MITKIKDFPNYGVDEDGNIYSFGRMVHHRYRETVKLNPRPNNKGYLVVHLYNEYGMSDKLVHRIVAETFIPNPENKPEVNHINGNKNESAENKEQKYDYNCTSHCKNKGSYEKFARCRANNSSCIRYEIRRKSDGTELTLLEGEWEKNKSKK